MTKVLVTGATGFIASHTILALIEKGYEVRGTARSANKAARLNAILSDYAGKAIEIELVSADLTSDDGWSEAMEGVTYLQHLASPIPNNLPKDANELIIPARDGALRALKAAKAAGVKRAVMTSSMAAIAYGWGDKRPDILDETHWSNPDNIKDNTAYTRSKAIAEKAAWDYVNGEGAGLELATINPVAVLGPAMSGDVSASLELVTQAMQNKVPAYPKLTFGIVDVRDVAKAHVEAMERPAAAGERFLVGNEVLSFSEIGDILREAFPDRKLPKGELPNWLVRMMVPLNPTLKQILPELGKRRAYTNAKAREQLGIDFIPAKDAIIASAQTLVDLGEL
ncbi:NAD-dependent epimerase/dehydratase family protein [Hyphomonas sp. FCG-A18]|uniref:NAD-dependent epimerase/dehydratase family protein n=1 Tax=Hyphomonas sp. FCG-A18 TaxID=3080019 RepID=UPI002B2D41CC|nr:NAD-dependent epimerase/dehydratase family protein [Hyphomonas sp. FCG-A18]